MRLTFPQNAVVVVAGLPGAGKTTLIRRVVERSAAAVVDTDDQRHAGGRASCARHYRRILAAVWGDPSRPVVIHSRGTVGTLRRAITLASALRGRPAHLILLDVPPPVAVAGQRRRGRLVARSTMEREVARWRRLRARGVRGEGWASVTVLDRAGASAVTGIDWEPTAGLVTALAPAYNGVRT